MDHVHPHAAAYSDDHVVCTALVRGTMCHCHAISNMMLIEYTIGLRKKAATPAMERSPVEHLFCHALTWHACGL